MRVIEQLVKYYWDRGILSLAEVRYLVRQGFARAEELHGFEPEYVPDPNEGPYDHYTGDEGMEEYGRWGCEAEDRYWRREQDEAILEQELEEQLAARRPPQKKIVGAGRRHRKSARRKVATVRAVSSRGVTALREWAVRNRHRELAATLLQLLSGESRVADRRRNLLLGLPEVRALGLGRPS